MGIVDWLLGRRNDSATQVSITKPPVAPTSSTTISDANTYLEDCFKSDLIEQPENRVWFEVEGLEALNGLVYGEKEPKRALAMTEVAVLNSKSALRFKNRPHINGARVP